MLLSYLLISLLCTLGVKSNQPSYFCYPIASVLPPDHDCWKIFNNETMVMVPGPEQTNVFLRNVPNDPKEIRSVLDASISASQQQIGLLSNPDYCSKKILTLICLFYFPTCGYDSEGDLLPPFFPCLSVCEEVTAPKSECSRRINSTWGPYYNGCNYQYFSGGDSINKDGGYRDVYRDSSCADGTHACKNELSKDDDKTHKCRKRKSKIFNSLRQLVKLKSTFVLNCTITSLALDGNGICNKRAIKCRVNQFYGLKNDTCEQACPGTEVYVLGYPISCPIKKTTSIYQTFEEASIGDTFFIAGKHVIQYCGQTYLYLTHRDIVVEQSATDIPNDVKSKQC